MKESGKSSLNPYAASYVPLFRRGAGDATRQLTSAQEYNRGNEARWSGHQPQIIVPHGQHHVASEQIHGHGLTSNQNADFTQQNENQGGEIFTSTSQYPNNISEKVSADEYGMDMELDFLQMTFPGMSYESLRGVYKANGYDVVASIDMLNQLELHPDDSLDILPETLDIGDVPESSGPVGEQAGGASTSASSHLPSTS